MEAAQKVKQRPAEITTGVTGAVAAILVATTGMDTGLATALVVLVGAVPLAVTGFVNLRKSTVAGQQLVDLTTNVTTLAKGALVTAGKAETSLKEKTDTLKAVTDSVASWVNVLLAQPGAAPTKDERAGSAGK